MKLSKMRWRFASSLKGMSLKQYTAVERFKASTVVTRARKYVDRSLWIKLDRRKPMSDDQAAQIKCAINKALLELVANYPFEIPVFSLSRKPVLGYKNKYVYLLTHLDLITLPPIGTPYGTAYKVREGKYEHHGLSGPITFSGHAIERLLERVPALDEICRTEWAAAFLVLLERITEKPDVDRPTLMLNCNGLGHFPMTWVTEKGIWVCTTFLLPGFKKTPEDVDRQYEELLRKWS